VTIKEVRLELIINPIHIKNDFLEKKK